jgi:hypothetical protein
MAGGVKGDAGRICAARHGVIFAERILPRASGLWVQASLTDIQRLQQRFLPDRVASNGTRFDRTASPALLFKPLTVSWQH